MLTTDRRAEPPTGTDTRRSRLSFRRYEELSEILELRGPLVDALLVRMIALVELDDLQVELVQLVGEYPEVGRKGREGHLAKDRLTSIGSGARLADQAPHIGNDVLARGRDQRASYGYYFCFGKRDSE